MESIVPLSAFSPAKAPAMINATYTLFLRINVYIYEYPISIWQTIVAEKRKKHHREQQTLYTASNMVTMDSGSTLKCILYKNTILVSDRMGMGSGTQSTNHSDYRSMGLHPIKETI